MTRTAKKLPTSTSEREVTPYDLCDYLWLMAEQIARPMGRWTLEQRVAIVYWVLLSLHKIPLDERVRTPERSSR